MTATRTRIALCTALLATTPAALALAQDDQREKGGGEGGFRPLEQAKEESGVPAPPPQRFALPGARLVVTPSALITSNPGQRVRFEVELTERVPGATLSVRLPRRWLDRPASGLPAIAGLRRRGRAALRRAARTVELELEEQGTGATASFEVEDRGIPAGTYRLPFSWRDADGRRSRAGTATVTFYARVREGEEGEEDNPWARLPDPGVEANATGDGVEESETFIAVTPGNRDRIAVGANWSSPSMAAWISNDTGQTWIQRTLPQTLDIPGSATNLTASVCCDPMFAADALGNFWYGGLATGGGGRNRIIVNRIAAGTTTFRPTTVALPRRTSGVQDKPMMTIDDHPASPTFGRIYVVWDEPGSGGGINLVISQCDTRPSGVSNPAACDNADNWTPPVSVTPAEGSYIYPDVSVGPDGRVYVVWWDYSNVNAIRGDVCDPASQTCSAASGWGTPQTIALLDSTGGAAVPFACPIRAQPGGRASTSPQVDVDHSGGANHGRVYVTWSDLRTGSGTTRCGDTDPPAITHLSFDSFVASASGGALPGGTQSSPNVGTRLITDGESGGAASSDDWFAWLAVDQTTGLAWADLYSTRDDVTRQTTNFYARSVTPSGGSHTLGPLTRVSSAASDYSDEECCTFGNDYGDYTGIDATEGTAYPVWTDNSTGDGEAFTFVADVQMPQAPVVTAANATSVGQTSATLNGSVNPNGQETSWHFEYGTSPGGPYTSSTPDQSAGEGTTNTTVSAQVNDLSPGTQYYFRLVATNASGTTSGAERTFTTDAQPPTPTQPSVTTGSATEIETDRATLNATINPNGAATSFQFEYGTQPGGPYPNATAPQNAGSGTTDAGVSAQVTGLTEGTDYYFRVVATNSEGSSTGQQSTFKTDPPSPPPPDTPPIVTTGDASLVGTSSATVRGSVNPNGKATSWQFQYGTSTAYGLATPSVSAGDGSSVLSVSARLSFLAPSRVYHYRLVATNASGTSAGADRTFTTASVFVPPVSPPPPDRTAPVIAISRRPVRLGRRRILRVRLRCGSGEREACRGRLRLYTSSGRRRLASARFDVDPGRTERIRARLSRTGLRLLRRRGRMRVLARAAARDSAGNVGRARTRFTLRAPRPR